MKRARNTPKTFTFIDLFAGIGGFRLGLERLGGECVFTSEWDAHSQKTYSAWYDEYPHGDITKIDPTKIPHHEVLAAGFPCQPFSIAGVSKKNSLGREHGFRDKTQGTLFFHIAEILEAKRPPIAILENVKNLRSHDRGRTFATIVETLNEIGYVTFDKVIDGKHWVPQHRERVLIVCLRKDVFGSQPDFEFPVLPRGEQRTLSEILEKKPDPKYTLSDHLWQYLQDYAAKHKAKGNGFGFGLTDRNGIARTISARYYKDGSEILIPQRGLNPRRLTPLEALRLMGFDEIVDKRERRIVVSDTQAYRQFGNAVIPAVVEYAARNAIKMLIAAKRDGSILSEAEPSSLAYVRSRALSARRAALEVG
ncbi:MAG: DNA (cytosine-5-)-methyltransferase [Candidatus Kapabacteria bacterium]|nr:DNA (cytosine-5-)-methyltransferase [Candidatus Kapabacteria bacterium]